jgi:hypothetical protein
MKLHVSSMSVLKAIDGMLKVEMPEGWQCQPDTLAFEGVLATKPAATDAVVSVEAGAISSDGAKRGNAAAGVTGATGATPETGIGKATLTTAGGIRRRKRHQDYGMRRQCEKRCQKRCGG